jgi:hypothetical protein
LRSCHVTSARGGGESITVPSNKKTISNVCISRVSDDFKNPQRYVLPALLATKCKHRAQRTVNAYVLELDQIKTED